MGTRASVHAVYGKDEFGRHIKLRDEVGVTPTYSQKQSGVSPKVTTVPIAKGMEKTRDTMSTTPKQSVTKPKSKGKSKKR